ncbi:zinc finger protein 518B isoform X2 [Danio aesculapii]|uniref:zinc finger protein 518B isoform X2 n=1 Tax=Danio aesculapii TaxID=1142201 RepID=UPI0024C02461|nr:zinc finger protein 518B isoform X2 [Danio aesculapii]
MRSQQSFMSFVNNRKDIDRLCCAKCRFSTKDTELFERHVSHHEEMTFSCVLCSHVSYSKTESQKHIVSHTGSYPYRCSFCSYGAVRRDYLVKHILRIHKKNAEEGFKMDQDCDHSSVPETLWMSGWLKRNDQPTIPSSHVELPSGSQPRVNKSSVIAKSMSQTSSSCGRVTCTTTAPSISNTTVALSRTQFPSGVPSCSTSASHTSSKPPQVVLRSREENGTLFKSLLNTDSKSKVASRRAVLEKPIPKATFPRVQSISTEPLQQSPRVGVPEKGLHSKTVPRVQVRLPAEMNTALRPLLNMPLSKRNAQVDLRATQSTTGTNTVMQKTAGLSRTPIRGPLHLPAEKSNQTRTNTRALVGSSTEVSSPLSNVQVELLAPLNQPIQHNKPLTVSCPEEINIPAGCLVELVEVKNINGTRELELRLIPPNAVPQDKRSAADGSSQDATGSKLSFKCQVAAKECPVSPSTSSTFHQVKQQQSSASPDTKTSAHKLQRSSKTPTRSKINLTGRDSGIKRTAAAHEGVMLEGPELSSEGLPVISSVFSLCPTPTLTQSLPQGFPETQRWTVTTKEPKDKVRSGDRSLVCSILIKKEEEPEEKPKLASVDLQGTKTEPVNTEDFTVSKVRVKRAGKTLDARHLKQNPNNVQVSQPSVIPKQGLVSSNKDNIPHHDKEAESGRMSEHHSSAPLKYPKVSLVRIPSSLLDSAEKPPEAPAQEESLTARPVLCCTLREQNVSGSPEVAIKLILKRDLRASEEKHSDYESPPRKKHKKEKRKDKKRRSSMGLSHTSTEALRITPLRDDQLVKIPGPNQPVVVLNHPNPAARTMSVGVQTLKNYKWICSMDQEQTPTERKQPSLKMKLKKVHGQNYQILSGPAQYT